MINNYDINANHRVMLLLLSVTLFLLLRPRDYQGRYNSLSRMMRKIEVVGQRNEEQNRW